MHTHRPQASKEVDYGSVQFAAKFRLYSPTNQADRQIFVLLHTLGIALVSGAVCGVLLKLMPSPVVRHQADPRVCLCCNVPPAARSRAALALCCDACVNVRTFVDAAAA
jgi:hypothetical protein